MFDEYADKKFKERPKRDIFKDEKYKEYLEDEEPKVEDVDTTEVDIADTGKDYGDELDAYTKDLEDYLEKNPKAKDKNYY